MGASNVLVLCLVAWCAGGMGRSVAAPRAPGEVGDYKYNYVMRKLFDEMNSVMSHVVAKKNDKGGSTIKGSALVQKVKQILVAKDNSRKKSGKVSNAENSGTTDAIGVFRSIFNKVAGGIDQLYIKRRKEHEKRNSRSGGVNLRSKPHYGRRPSKPTRTNSTTATGPRKEILRGVDIPTAVNSITPLLNRLKEADFKRKHEYIYYEESSGSESAAKRSADAGVGHDDTEQGSGETDDESGDDDADAESGSGKAPGKSVKVVQGQGHGEVVRHVARARDRRI